MTVGAHLYRITRRRAAVAFSILAASVACVLTLYRPTPWPLGLHPRALQISGASTELLVAEPSLAVSGSNSQYNSLVNRSILVGNMMVTQPVLTSIGKAIHVNPARIQASAPITANVPRALAEPGSGAGVSQIVASPDQYRLEVQADPSVPILHVYSQAPSSPVAIRLAQSAVTGLIAYLQQLASRGQIPPSQRVRIEQLGPVLGGTANPSAPVEMAFLVFVGVLGICLWLSAIVARIRGGWASERLAHQLPS